MSSALCQRAQDARSGASVRGVAASLPHLMLAAIWIALHAAASVAHADDTSVMVSAKRAELEAAAQPAAQGEPKGVGEPEAREPDYLALADAPLFLPRNYLYWGTPVGPKGLRKPLVFGLEYALHLPIYNNLRDSVLMGRHWAGAATLSFEGALRMLAIESKPVRMPSYRPGMSGQLFYTHYGRAPLIVGLRFSLFHYSNGQERCAYDASVGDQTEACRQKIHAARSPSRALNRLDGDFTTNGYLFELNARMHELNERGVAVGHVALGVAMEAYLRRGPGAMDPALRDLYGWARIEANAEAKRRFGWAACTLRGDYTYYAGSGPGVPRHAGYVQLVVDPYWLTGLGLFARYYGGRDFYNAFFVDHIQQFSAGLAWDGERPLKFKQAR